MVKVFNTSPFYHVFHYIMCYCILLWMIKLTYLIILIGCIILIICIIIFYYIDIMCVDM